MLKDIFSDIDKPKESKEITPITNRIEIDRLTRIAYERQLEELGELKPMFIGAFLLMLGFILQIIGNWLQNPPL